MRIPIRLMLLAAFAGVLVTGCSDNTEIPTEPVEYDSPPAPTTMPTFASLPALSIVPPFVVADPAVVCADGQVNTLYAGQDMDVGFTCTEDDGFSLTVTYYGTEVDWCLMETHTHVFQDDVGFTDITLKNGNPPPGQFDQKGEDLGCVYMDGPYTFDVLPGGVEYFVAAHAVFQEILEFGPYAADGVEGSQQGVRKDGSAINADRQDPNQALVPDWTGPSGDISFFSLGFAPATAVLERYVEVSFSCPLRNAEGDDVQVWEATGGTYPLELAPVSAWDGAAWVVLGNADNTEPGFSRPSSFDLGSLPYTTMIRVEDNTDPGLFDTRPNADAFDVDGVIALNDCWGDDETAWAADDVCVSDDKNDYGCDFPGKNWATYFSYTTRYVFSANCPVPLVGGHVLISPPSSVAAGVSENAAPQLFGETVQQVPAGSVPVDEGSLTAGDYVCSYYLHADAAGSGPGVTQVDGFVVFSEGILALAYTGSRATTNTLPACVGVFYLYDTDGLFGNPLTTYPVFGVSPHRGLECGNQDKVTYPDGATVKVSFELGVAEATDGIRIFLPTVPAAP